MAEVITVSALNRYVKTLLDANDALFDLALRGEIANFVQNARSGHCYFSLRDDVCSVKAVMFRTDARRLAFRPEEGMRVVVRCRATLYERDGAFQLYVNDMFRMALAPHSLHWSSSKQSWSRRACLPWNIKSRCRNFLNASVLLPARRELPCRTSAMCSHGAGHRYGCCCVR